MKISVVIPVFNVAPYLRECLDSVLSQSFSDWEAICVDDGSLDGSGKIIDEYAKIEGRIKAIHIDNQGVGTARNVGLDLASGEWLLFLDGDDALPLDAFEKYVALTEKYKYDAYFMDRPMRFHDMPSKSCEGNSSVSFDTDCGADLLRQNRRLPGFPFVRLLRRSLFWHIRFPEGVPMMEDYLSLFDVLSVKARFALVNLRSYCYRERPQSASRTFPVGRVRSIFEIYRKVYDIIRTRLSLNEEDAAWYFIQDKKAIQYYFYEGLRSESVENLQRVASIMVELNNKCGKQLSSKFIALRCWILMALGNPFGFGLIKAFEYVYRGVKTRL